MTLRATTKKFKKTEKPQKQEKTRRLFSIPKPIPIPTENRQLSKNPIPIPTDCQKSIPQGFS
jgi:hypothetical protein